MVQQPEPDDYVLATGEAYSVRRFVEEAFEQVGITIQWEKMASKKGANDVSRKTLVEIDPKYFRPSEVDTLTGDPSKARHELGWEAKTSFETLVEKMVQSDTETLEQDGKVALDYLE